MSTGGAAAIGAIMVLDGAAGDSTAPTLSVAHALGSASSTSVTTTATAADETDASVTHYLGVYANDSSTPSTANIIACTGTGVVSGSCPSGSAANGVQRSLTTAGVLSPSTAYDAWRTVCDGSSNCSTPTKVDFTTGPAGITFDTSCTGSATSTASVSATCTIAAGASRIAFACLNDESSSNLTTVTVSGNPMLPVPGAEISHGSNTSWLYYALNDLLPASGSMPVVANRDGTGAITLQVAVYDGVLQVVPSPAGAAIASNTDTLTVSGITTTFDNSLIDICAAGNGANAWDAVAGQTERADTQVGSMTGLLADKAIASAGSASVTAENSTSQSRITMAYATIAPVGGVTPPATEVPVQLEDAFTDSNATAIGSHTPDVDETGNGWTTMGLKGASPGTIDIQSNKAEIAANSAMLVDVGSSNLSITADWTPTAGQTNVIAIPVRPVDNQNYVAGRFNASTSQVQIFKRVAGAETVLATKSSVTMSGGSTYQVNCDARGSTVTCGLDGTLQVSATDAAFSSATSIGIGSEGSTVDQVIDDVTVTYTYSAFTGAGRISDDPLGVYAGESPQAGSYYTVDANNLPSTSYTLWLHRDGGGWAFGPETDYVGSDSWGVRGYNSTTNAYVTGTVTYTTQNAGAVAPVWTNASENVSWGIGVPTTVALLPAYAATIGSPVPTCAQQSGTIAAGMVLNGQSCTLSGTPSTGYVSPPAVVIRVSNSAGFDDLTINQTITGDAVPDAFTFVDQNGVTAATLITSAATSPIAGINIPAAITVSGDTGCAYQINGTGGFTASAGTVVDGDTVEVQVTSGTSGQAKSCTATIGGISSTFTTIAGTPPASAPNPFSFTPQTGVARSATITSAGVVITGNTAAAAVTCSGGTCAINGGAYSTSPGNANAGDSITARHTSSASYNTPTSTLVTVGGVTGTFTSTTLQEIPVCTDIPTQNHRVGDAGEIDFTDHCAGATTVTGGTLPSGAQAAGAVITYQFNAPQHVVTQYQACNNQGCDNVRVAWHVEAANYEPACLRTRAGPPGKRVIRRPYCAPY